MCLKSHYGGKTPLNPSHFKLNKYYLKLNVWLLACFMVAMPSENWKYHEKFLE